MLDGLVQDALAHSPRYRCGRRRAFARRWRRCASAAPARCRASAPTRPICMPKFRPSEAAAAAKRAGSDSSLSSLDFYNLGLNASWEVDLFGGGRRQREQSRATLGARQADLADVQVSLSAQVAQAYINLRDAQQRAVLNTRSIALQEQTLGLVRQRFDQGRRVRNSTSSGCSPQLDSSKAQVQPLQGDIAAYLDQIAMLTGREPGALDARLAAATAIPLPPAQVAVRRSGGAGRAPARYPRGGAHAGRQHGGDRRQRSQAPAAPAVPGSARPGRHLAGRHIRYQRADGARRADAELVLPRLRPGQGRGAAVRSAAQSGRGRNIARPCWPRCRTQRRRWPASAVRASSLPASPARNRARPDRLRSTISASPRAQARSSISSTSSASASRPPLP